MRMLLAGLWTRRGMNATSLVVCVIAVVAAVLGPMYARESAEHLLDTRLDERAPYTLGLTYSVPAQDGTEVPRDDPAAFRAPAVDDLVAEASAPFRAPAVGRFWSAGTAWALDAGGQFDRGAQRYVAPAYWRAGMCTLAEVRGRCPTAAGEALMQATMARTLGLAAGDTFDVTYSDTYLRRGAGAPGGVEAQRPRTVSYRIVGTYRVADPESPAWFDLSRFTGLDDLVVPPQRGSGAAPTAPALLVAPASMTSQTFRAGLDRPLDTGAVDLGTMDATEQAARDFKGAAIDAAAGSQTDLLADLDVASVFDQVRAERTALSRVMVAALAPLVLLTLLLLFALVSTAAQARRPHVALAKLRGQSGGQVLRFALSEPFLVVAAAVPVGVGVAVAAAHLAARGWLHPGIPVALDTVTWVALVLVVLASLAASTAAALTVIREPLASSLGCLGAGPPGLPVLAGAAQRRGRGGPGRGRQPAHLRRPVQPAARAAHPDVRGARGRGRGSGPAARAGPVLGPSYGGGRRHRGLPRVAPPRPASGRGEPDGPAAARGRGADLRRLDRDDVGRLAGGPRRGRGGRRPHLRHLRDPGPAAAGHPRGRPGRALPGGRGHQHGRRRPEPQRVRGHLPAGARGRPGTTTGPTGRSPPCSGELAPDRPAA